MSKKRVYFNEFNIPTKSSVYLPYSSGLLQAYAETFSIIRDNYEFAPFLFVRDDISNILKKYNNPEIVAFSCSVWNFQVSLTIAKAVKEKFPKCLIIFGGPQIPLNAKPLFDKYPFIDLAFFSEGERLFAETLIQNLIDRDKLPFKVCQKKDKTAEDLDIFPSPYSNGLFQEIMEIHKGMEFKTVVESNRACPFSSFSKNNYIALPDRIVVLDEEEYLDKLCIECSNPNHTHRKCKNDERIMHQGKADCIRFDLSNGSFFEVTKNHKVSFINKNTDTLDEKDASEISLGDWIPVQIGQNTVEEYQKLNKIDMSLYPKQTGRRKPNAIKFPDILNKDLAWFLGFLIGDGSIAKVKNKDGKICLRAALHLCITDEVEDKLINLTDKLFGLKLAIYKASNTDKMKHGWIYSRILIRYLNEVLGIEPLKEKLKVPRKIFKSPKSVVKAFLDGLWAADAYEPPSSPSYLVTISEKLANEIYNLINWIGDASFIRGYDNSNNKSKLGPNRIIYRVFWITEKYKNQKRGRPNIYNSIPLSFGLYKNNNIIIKRKQKYNTVLRSHLKIFDKDHILLKDNIYYTQITKIINKSNINVYDVHNCPTHMVGANSVFIRQCSFCYWGQSAVAKKLAYHSLEYITKEVEWIANNNIKYVFCADANFGMFKRDQDIAKIYAEYKEKYSYPEKFRVCYGKNKTDLVFETASILSKADLAKTVTLAIQSNDPETLKNIKRGNIKISTFIALQKKYTEAGIPTYTEIILGLPGETKQSFIDGLDTIISSIINNQVFIYHCQILPNTEMADPEYIKKYNIKTVKVPMSEVHGNARLSGEIPEYDEVIIGTYSMPVEDWIECAVISSVTQLCHGLKVCFDIVEWLVVNYNISRMSIYTHFIKSNNKYIRKFWDIARGVTKGQMRCQTDPLFGEIYWEPEEFTFTQIAYDKENFYNSFYDSIIELLDINNLIYSIDELKNIFEQQKEVIPDTNDFKNPEEFATQVVLYGRKSNKTTKKDITNRKNSPLVLAYN